VRDLAFTKYEGLGNDFLVVDAKDSAEVPAALAAKLCDRRLGVGGDGVLLVLPPAEGAARMRVINADGSVPEMCGNGLRCVALHVARARGAKDGELTIETDAGPRRCAVEDAQGEGIVTIDMGVVRVTGERSLEVDGEALTFALADAGNPHAILFGAWSREAIARIGPQVATHASFPKGTNVEFARAGVDGIDLVVWERGVGLTLACGTGACATAAAACMRGVVEADRRIAVRLPGGTLEVTYVAATSRVIMRGPARRVFAGVVAV